MKAIDDILHEIQNSHIGTVFRMMEIAEDVLDEFQAKYPEHRDVIHNSFSVLRPSRYLSSAPLKLYRIYAEELVQRIVDGDDLNLGTDAELLIAFKEMSLVAPLHAEAATAYARLFNKHFPGVVNAKGVTDYEQYPGSIEERYAEMRKKLASQRSRPTNKPKTVSQLALSL